MKVITIGRSLENDVPIDDPCASRHHLQIIQHDDGHFTLSDFGSTNGTYVNGQKITGEIFLNENDIVRIGNSTIPWRLYFETDKHDVTEINENSFPYYEDATTTSSNSTMSVEKERHGFVTFWLWLMIIGNFIGVIMQAMSANYAIWAYATEENATIFFYFKHGMVDYYIYASYFMIVLSLVNIAGAIVLLKWKKLGYWLFVGSAITCMAIMVSFAIIGGFTTAVGSSMAGAIVGPVILWAILQIKKNGVSCWKLLE